MARDHIPVALLTPHIEAWAKRVATDVYGDCDLTVANHILHIRSGISKDLLSKIQHGRYRPHVGWDTADKIICALGDPNIWFTDDLWPFYCEGDDPTQPITCARDGCEKTFVPNRGGGSGSWRRQKYCSKSCVTYACAVRKGRKRIGARTRWGNGHASGTLGRQKRPGEFSCGHERSSENTEVYWHNGRQRYYPRCAECHRATERRRRERMKNRGTR